MPCPPPLYSDGVTSSSVQEVIATDAAKETRMMAISFFMVGVCELKRFLVVNRNYLGSIPCPPPFITVLGTTSSSVQAVKAIEVAKATRSM